MHTYFGAYAHILAYEHVFFCIKDISKQKLAKLTCCDKSFLKPLIQAPYAVLLRVSVYDCEALLDKLENNPVLDQYLVIRYAVLRHFLRLFSAFVRV